MGINLYRKLFHISSGLIIYGLSYKISYISLGVVLIFLWMGLSLFEFLRLFFYKYLPLKFLWLPLLKEEEHKRISDAWYFLTGIFFSWFILDLKYFQIILLILTLADPCASMIGYYFGKIKLKNNKTLEGSLAFFITSSLILFLNIKTFFSFLYLCCIILSLVEAFTKRDNFWIPLIGSLYLKILG
uniref:Phosphatidate cytidylyltransferase n=1 Tax=Thermodesulfobacterium geofontis TaxID=1295609 RepID=A0A7V5XGL2_9BACT